MRLLLVRHGQTEANMARTIQGQTHGLLSVEGRRQVGLLANQLKDEDIGIIYSSDLARAKDTAKEIAKHHFDAPLHFTELLRERHYGALEGASWDDIDWEKLPADVESEAELTARAREFVSLCSGHQETVLAVSHGGFLMVLMSVILKKSVAEMWEMGGLDNTSLSILSKEGGRYKLEMFNSTSHLSQA